MRALLVIAHPDDEVFVSGTLCLLARSDILCGAICLTDGAGGDLKLIWNASRSVLAETRLKELELSLNIVGCQFLGSYRLSDVANPVVSPMGWPERVCVDRLSAAINDFQPDMILTHGPLGGYGHKAHQLTYQCVNEAVTKANCDASIYTFPARTKHSFFSWHEDDPATVTIDVREFDIWRAASLGYHQSQISYFVQPQVPTSLRKFLSATFGYTFSMTEAGRRRIPIATARRFMAMRPQEGLSLRRGRNDGSDFLSERFGDDKRFKFDSKNCYK
jgi:LmbE family N-acetylglucosaminyl deacetylase